MSFHEFVQTPCETRTDLVVVVEARRAETQGLLGAHDIVITDQEHPVSAWQSIRQGIAGASIQAAEGLHIDQNEVSPPSNDKINHLADRRSDLQLRRKRRRSKEAHDV